MKPARLGASVSLLCLVVSACGSNSSDRPLGPDSTFSTTSSTSSIPEAPVEPEDGSGPGDTSTLLVLGDWGSGTEPQGAVAGAMSRYAAEHEIAAILTTGDNFYTNDFERLMQPFEWAVMADIQFWITWGNHDIESNRRIDAVDTAFDSPPKWGLHEWGEVDVIVLDSNQVESPEQIEFLATTMEESLRPTIVVFHHAALSCSNHGDNSDVLERWVPMFDDDVFLVLSGHDHNYQRFDSDNVTYVVTGGGGRRLYDLEPCPDEHPPQLAAELRFHFLGLDQVDQTLTIKAIDVNGALIDETEISMP